jgi:putative restriction endonuclease
LHAVLDTKPGSIYDDSISQRYHFPSRYLKVLEKCIGEWVIYREPRADGGSMAYIAAAKLREISADPDIKNHFYAHVTDFEEFDALVPWRVGGVYWEKKLREIDTPSVGVYMRGRSVRELTDADFSAIVSKGLNLHLGAENEVVSETRSIYFEEPLNGEKTGEARQTVQVLSNKKLRDQRFRSRIVRAYDGICAFTGARMQDYKGHHEVQAAHILSVAENGPDVTSNGLALSSTIHWMFDRHLVSVDEDFKLLIADSIIPNEYLNLLEPATKGILLPKDRSKVPNQSFIRTHRSRFDLRANLSN